MAKPPILILLIILLLAESILTEQICGNGILEESEECDCDPGDNKCKECCNTNDCLYKYGSSCLNKLAIAQTDAPPQSAEMTGSNTTRTVLISVVCFIIIFGVVILGVALVTKRKQKKREKNFEIAKEEATLFSSSSSDINPANNNNSDTASVNSMDVYDVMASRNPRPAITLDK